MKLNNIIIPLAALLLTTACDDQIMKWGTPEGHGTVTAEEIPLAVKEVLANYAPVKEYAKQYTPNMLVGLGMGASLYTENYKDVFQGLANENFQMFTPGNAMKMDAVVGNSGKLNFAGIDALLDAMPSEVRLYGHNFIWYQQQSQTYLKSLIAPTMVVKTDGDIASVLANGGFDADLSSWSGWGNSSTREWVKAGEDGSGCAHLVNPTDANPWSAQMVQNFSMPLEAGKTYTLRFKARCNIDAGSLQFVVQNNKTYKGEGVRHGCGRHQMADLRADDHHQSR